MRWFVWGFVFGSALFAAMWRFDITADWIGFMLPHWLFLADPLIWLICDVFHRAELCIGLGLDGGPLEWLEWLWMFIAPGLLYGTLAWLLGALWQVRAR